METEGAEAILEGAKAIAEMLKRNRQLAVLQSVSVPDVCLSMPARMVYVLLIYVELAASTWPSHRTE